MAWCTERARGTIDIDVNIFVSVERVDYVVSALPPEVRWTETDRALLVRDGQARLWWDNTPVDVFLNTTEFHQHAALRARVEHFAGEQIPFRPPVKPDHGWAPTRRELDRVLAIPFGPHERRAADTAQNE